MTLDANVYLELDEIHARMQTSLTKQRTHENS